MTETAVIVLCDKEILIWAIPSLSPQLELHSSLFERHPTCMPPPLFTIPFPDGVSPERIAWKTVSSWYFGSSHSLYFDMICGDFKLHRFQIMLAPDLSTISLRVINTHEPIPHNFNYVSYQDYRICEDTLVSCSFHYEDRRSYV